MSGLARLGITGERSRRAQENLGRASADLVLALRRVLPFLTRKRVAVIAAPARTVLFAELAEAIPDLAFTMPFAAGARRAPGILAIDGVGAARILDGVLGGGEGEPAAGGPPLSSAQLALAGRVAEGVLRAFSEALRARLGVALEPALGTALREGGRIERGAGPRHRRRAAMSGLARLGITGERSRRAQENLGRASADLVLALRRALRG